MKRTMIPIATAIAALGLTQFAPAQDQDPFANPSRTGQPNRAATVDDPFAPKPPAPPRKPSPTDITDGNISICFETFSLDLPSAAAMMRALKTDAALYQDLVELVSSGKARQEGLTVLRARTGQRSMAEAIAEQVYPTEWDPAEIPQTVGVQIVSPDKKAGTPPEPPALEKLDDAPKVEEIPLFTTPSSPTAFETRNIGFTLEVEPFVGADNNTIDLNLAPEFVSQAGMLSWGQGVSKMEVPEFESQRIATQITAKASVPRLLGTMNRPPVSEVDRDSPPRIWFAFVTASAVK